MHADEYWEAVGWVLSKGFGNHMITSGPAS